MPFDHMKSPTPSYKGSLSVLPLKSFLPHQPHGLLPSLLQLHIQSGQGNFILNCMQTY